MLSTMRILPPAAVLTVVLVAFWAGTAGAECPVGDMDNDCDVDWEDVRLLVEEWQIPKDPVIEAEDYTSKTDGSGAAAGVAWVERTGGGSSGGLYMEALPDAGLRVDTNIETESPHLAYGIDFATAGTYYLWVSGWADDPYSRYIHYGLDGSAVSSNVVNAAKVTDGSFGWRSQRGDGLRPTFTVDSAGPHTLDIWMREDGAKIDQLLVTDDPDYTPSVVEAPLGDLNGDNNINFVDFALLAQNWLVVGTLPLNECDNWQVLHPEWIFCDDFEDGTPLVREGRYFQHNSGGGGDFILMDGVGVDGSKGMRALWSPDEVQAGSLSLGFGRNPNNYMNKGIEEDRDFTDIYYRMYLKMQDGWVGNPAKLSRATIFTSPSVWTQAMIAHLWGGEANCLKLEPVSLVDANCVVLSTKYNDFDNMQWLNKHQYGGIGDPQGITPIFDSQHSGIWYCIEAHVKLNDTDPEVPNGLQEFWIDGNLEARRTNMNFVKCWDDYAINAIFFENYWNSGSPVEQERYFDNIVVSTEPIGPRPQ